MKWFLAALVAANALIALLGALSKPVVTDITTRESNANQIKLVPTGEISPLAALTAPKAGSALPPTTPDAPAPAAPAARLGGRRSRASPGPRRRPNP